MKLEETPLFLYRPSGELDAHGESCAALGSEGIQYKYTRKIKRHK